MSWCIKQALLEKGIVVFVINSFEEKAAFQVLEGFFDTECEGSEEGNRRERLNLPGSS